MKPYLRIKGTWLWKMCALVILGIAVGACLVKTLKITQPASAHVGDVITIKLHDTLFTQQDNPRNPEVTHYVLGLLLPKGWNAGDPNITQVSFTSQDGNGNMIPMPDAAIEPFNTLHQNWPTAMMAKFGIGPNLVNDLEWVVFESQNEITLHSQEKPLNPDAVITIKVGADGNDTYFFPGYAMAGTYDGLQDDTYWGNGPDWGVTFGNCLLVTNGTTGDIHDYCHPQLTSVDPPKALENDFITISYNNKLETTALSGASSVYLCVDTVFTADGGKLTDGFCTQTKKSQLTETSSGSGLFKITFWPHSYFGLSATQSVTKIAYHITDATGNIRVGLNNTAAPFTYKFQCQ